MFRSGLLSDLILPRQSSVLVLRIPRFGNATPVPVLLPAPPASSRECSNPVCAGPGRCTCATATDESSASREFVQAGAARLQELCERRHNVLEWVALLIVGKEVGGETVVVAPSKETSGKKQVLDLFYVSCHRL